MNKMHRIAAAAALALCVSIQCMPAQASVVMEWDDLTDAQQEQAYRELESENERLRQQLAQLQGQTGTASDQSAAQDSGSGNSSTNIDTSGQTTQQDTSTTADTSQVTIKDVDTFLADIAASFNARQDVARTYSTDQVNAMSEADMWNFRFECAKAEKGFYDSYRNAQFDDLNVLYLCSEYCTGLEKQFKAQSVWESDGNSEEANKLYTAGYYNRAYALVELCEYYGLDLAQEYQNLKNAVTQMDALSGEETRNSSVDSATVMQVQELLNSLGFLCGTPDGIAGRQTASCVERFQVMYGYEPSDGIIDSELIGQLSQELSRRQG